MSSPKTLRVALVGCGRIGSCTAENVRNTSPPGWLPLSHTEAVRAIDNLELVALCDTNEQNMKKASTNLGISKCYSDYKLMISECKPDIVSIATRTAGRTDIISYAAKSGVKGIHFEKPISNCINSCDKAINAIMSNNIKITYGTTRRFMDTYRRAKELLEEGMIGDLVQVTINFGQSLLLWCHPHSVDLILYYVGSKDIDYIQGNCIVENSSVKDLMIDQDPIVKLASINFANGIQGLITSSAGFNTHLAGTKGNITIHANGSRIEIEKIKTKENPYFIDHFTESVSPEMSGTQRAFSELANSILTDADSPVDPDVIALSQRILLSILYSSLNEARRVRIEELPQLVITVKYGSYYA